MTSYQDVLVLFALLLRFDKKLFYQFKFFNKLFLCLSLCLLYAYVVAQLVVNTQHSTGCLLVCFPGMTSSLAKSKQFVGSALSDFSSKIFLFLIFSIFK